MVERGGFQKGGKGGVPRLGCSGLRSTWAPGSWQRSPDSAQLTGLMALADYSRAGSTA